MQSLRQQLAESEQKLASNSTKSDDVAQLQAEVGRMKTDLKKKVCISMIFVVLIILSSLYIVVMMNASFAGGQYM